MNRPENPVRRLYETFAQLKGKKVPEELAADLELRRRELRKKAEDDLWFFLVNVCEYADLYEPYHGELVTRLQNFEEPLVLMPRGTLKSTITSEGFPVWVSAKFPDNRTFICTETLDLARKCLRNQQGLIVKPLFRFLFEEYDIGEEINNYIYQYHWDSPIKGHTGEPTVAIASVEKEITGFHVETIIFDDLVGASNYQSRGKLDAVEHAYRHAHAVLMRDKNRRTAPEQTVVVGTRWCFDDLYQTLIEEKERPVILRKAREKDADGNEYITCPTMLTDEKLARTLQKLGPAFYSAQMQNDPISLEDAVFRPEEDLHYFEPDEIDLSALAILINVDPAESQEDNADPTCIMVTGIDADGRCYVLEYVNKKMVPSTMYDHLYRLCDKYSPVGAIYVESNGIGKRIMEGLRERGTQKKRWLPLKPLPSVANKHARIAAQLEPVVKARMLYVPKDPKAHHDLVDQMMKFPKGQHEDVLDALAMRFDKHCRGPRGSLPTSPQEGITEAHWDMWRERNATADPHAMWKKKHEKTADITEIRRLLHERGYE